MDEYQIPRERMIQLLREYYKIKDENVLDVMSKTPRHLFVPEAMKFQAYKDSALPIPGNQTISQPYIVAKMTELLEISDTSRVLEIGAGSGYQTTILSKLAREIFSIERISKLAFIAQETLEKLDIRNVAFKCGDGTEGWEIYSPFDAIIVAAGSPSIPPPLLKQLKIGGKLVIPIGEEGKSQDLTRITCEEGGFRSEDFGKCSFVPLIGKHGW